MLMSSHERTARAKVQLMERRQMEREAKLAKLPLVEGDCLDIAGDGKSMKKITFAADEGAAFALAGDEAVVAYTGWLAPDDADLSDEKVQKMKSEAPFDSNPKFRFLLAAMQVIPGWDIGVGTMRVGERALFLLHPDHGYGARGVGPIPPNSKLLFDITLLKASEPLTAHQITKPQILGGLVALCICIYYCFFFTAS